MATGDLGLETLPAIPASAGALVFDRNGRLLILKPTYKSGWTIPGGVMEADGESPWEACQREVREECGLDVRTGRLVCVDFRRPRPGRPGGVRFLFDCGAFGDAALGAIVLQAEEISEHRLVRLPTALKLLRGPIRRRVSAASGAEGLVYLEDGRPVPGTAPRSGLWIHPGPFAIGVPKRNEQCSLSLSFSYGWLLESYARIARWLTCICDGDWCSRSRYRSPL